MERKRRNPWLPERILDGYAPSLRRRYALRAGAADIWNGLLLITTLGHYGANASFYETVRLAEQHAKNFQETK